MLKKTLKSINLIDVIFLGLICSTVILFFFNLGNYGLADFDEAWYADIARNILKSGSLLLLSFNGMPYYDHPPAGFWLMALSMKIFGINEFAVRFSSALTGFSSVFLVYLIGRKLFSRGAGFIASLVLSSSVWFLFRARTGNLDAPLIFFLLSTLYCAIKTNKNSRWLPLFGLSAAFLVLTKSIIGFACLTPAIIYLFLHRPKISPFYLVLAIILFIFPIYLWCSTSITAYGRDFFLRQIIIGTRSTSSLTSSLSGFLHAQAWSYLQYGIGSKWYKLYLGSFLFIILFLRNKWKELAPFVATPIIMLAGFILKANTEIWHLMPIYPLIAIQIGSSYLGLFESSIFTINKRKFLVPLVTVSFFVLAIVLIKDSLPLLQLGAKGLDNRSYLATLARGRLEPLYQDGSSLWPTVIFYSEKTVYRFTPDLQGRSDLASFAKQTKKSFLVITEKQVFEQQNIPLNTYEVLEEKGNQILVLFKEPLAL